MDLLELLQKLSIKLAIPITAEIEEVQIQIVQGPDYRLELEEDEAESLQYKDKVCRFYIKETPSASAVITYTCKEKYLDGVREILRRTDTQAGNSLLEQLKDIKFNPDEVVSMHPDGTKGEIYPYSNQVVRRTMALTPEEVFRFIYAHITEF